MFHSAFGATKVTGQVRASLLGRSYAMRVIAAGKRTYLDEDGDPIEYNVLSATAQAQIIALGLVTDYKCMCGALGEKSDGVTISSVKEDFKVLYEQWREAVRLDNSVDGDEVKNTFDKYVKAFRDNCSDVGDAITDMLTKKTSYLQGKQIPDVPDLSKKPVRKTETVTEVQPDGSVQTKQVGLVDRFGKPVMVYPARKLWTTDVPLSEQSAIMAAARFTEISASLVIALKASVKGVMIKVD
mgnify:CR=1 FL=1